MGAKKKTRPAFEPKDELDRLYVALDEYVRSVGGTVVVAGPVRIVGRGRQYCHTFEIDFTGRAPDAATPAQCPHGLGSHVEGKGYVCCYCGEVIPRAAIVTAESL